MTGRYLVAAARIRQELETIALVVARATRAMRGASSGGPESDLLLDSVALNLHDFYVGLERVFEHVASAVDGSAPPGPEWHRELVRQMAVDLPEVRPAILRQDTVRALDDFLRFRHVVRNVYAFDLKAERLADLIDKLEPTFALAGADLLAFAAFLESVASDE